MFHEDRRNALRLALACVLVPAFGSAQAQPAAPAYPSKPIKFVVPVPAGGAADVMARMIATHLQTKWGQAVVVDNKPGAGSSVGMAVVAKAAPDGYTIGMGNVAANAINPAVRPESFPYDPVKDFAAVTMVGITPLILVVNPQKVPARTLPEFVAYLKTHPGKLSYGSSGAGSALHVGMELFMQKTGTSMVHVGYKGSAPMLTDLLGGQIDASMDAAATSWPQVQTGKLRALGISTAQRADFAPDLPPIAQSVKGFEMNPWHGVMAPAGTPPAIVEKLSTEIQAFLRQPDTEAKLRDRGVVRVGSSAAEFAKTLRDEAAFYKKLVADAGIKAE
ncbi:MULTISPECIES: Bug family tripartite tricarboxylate transporter substrate binding protein [Variovorax]|uniref:Bug family tripartite tricarboxylate transporter substrate binding protein n=1 Tax=Variovorax TaxID=34072 RepID=UPI002854ACF3|nr:tripartite tricarboxylate transporter substrate binding protein [Variovorax sp. 3319]MDR6889816.1 tripartite-type tricarboxylate transporter receptor subunit TctC [Variovorax sp. 3319]